MHPATAKWRDWDWDGDPYTPGRLSTPGRLIFCVFDLFEPGNPIGFKGDENRFASITQTDRLIDVLAGALINPAQTFILWTDWPERAARCLADDLLPVQVQRRAADVMETLAGVPDRPEYPVRPINLKTGTQHTAAEAKAFAVRYGGGAADFAGLLIPQGTPLLPNVWVGARLSGRTRAQQSAKIVALGDIPAAVRFLFLPGGCVSDFQRYVWGEHYEPIPAEGEGVIDTRRVPIRRIDWVLCGGINAAAAEYHIAQGIETGTPVWVEAANYLPFDCAVQMWPAQAEREPFLTPDIAAEQRRKERNAR